MSVQSARPFPRSVEPMQCLPETPKGTNNEQNRGCTGYRWRGGMIKGVFALIFTVVLINAHAGGYTGNVNFFPGQKSLESDDWGGGLMNRVNSVSSWISDKATGRSVSLLISWSRLMTLAWAALKSKGSRTNSMPDFAKYGKFPAVQSGLISAAALHSSAPGWKKMHSPFPKDDDNGVGI